MSNNHRGAEQHQSDHHKMSAGQAKNYDTQEAHKLEADFKKAQTDGGKSLTDELNKIQKEHPEELRNIVYKIKEEEHRNTKSSEFLPKVSMTNDNNGQISSITFESSDKHHNPDDQKAVVERLNSHGKYEIDTTRSSGMTAEKKAEAETYLTPEEKRTQQEGIEKAKALLGAAFDPLGTIVGLAAKAASKQ